MSIFLLGDVHGAFGFYKNWLLNDARGKRKPLEASLQIGDFGIFTEQDIEDSKIEGGQHKFFRGNHDCPELCRKHPNYIGDYGFHEKSGIFWVCGADSIDKRDRTIGVSWWEDEELSYQEGLKVIELYKQTRPKIVVTHTCPGEILPVILQFLPWSKRMDASYKGNSRTETFLQECFAVCEPELWVFGHFHHRMETKVRNTKFVCLGDHRCLPDDCILEIPRVSW